ncbi:MobC family plasmid mobilization relaxosome protein [Listeria costaricensis]|uniref:MobC family plasmid mobilization relaxosome protein n=1 Tax=Listeria costaricensis TaxID=2026604 RepID=UPI0013C3FE95|nr:MobC family plasmid mobilization relaxosome protein [Listeria costaricensis]
MSNLDRSIQVKFRVNEKENKLILQRMQHLKIKNKSAFLRKMALSGFAITVDKPDYKNYVAELAKIGNNINQIARIANTTKILSKEDIQRLEALIQQIWQLQKSSQSKVR